MRAALVISAWVLLGCNHPPQRTVPGTTQTKIASVTIRSVDGSALPMDFAPLLSQLGNRTGNLILPPRHFNAFRLAEDRRRVETFAGLAGYFEARASEPRVVARKNERTIHHQIDLGPRYRVGEMKLVGAPEALYGRLLEAIPFRSGAAVDVDAYRNVRHELADTMRWEGYSHARVYSRAWIHRERKTIDWFYFVDAGPSTHIASIEVQGNRRLATADILERSGLRVGQKYGARERQRAQLALLDAGSVASVVIKADDDIHKGPPEFPDSGGSPVINARGELEPRDLQGGLHLTIAVLERPRRELRLQAGSELDPSRSDVFAEARVVFRDLADVGWHFVTEGVIAYGYALGGSSQPLGLYGTASGQLVKPGLFASSWDFRAVGSLEHSLFPGASVREYAAGPGVRRRLADKLYLDADVRAFTARERDDLGLEAMQRADVGLSPVLPSSGSRVSATLVRDARDSGIEATRGHFLSAFAEHAPGLFGATHRWTQLAADVRGFHPLSTSYSLAAKLSGQWVGGAGDSGLPLHRRLFGGGAYGFRGFGRQAFSPKVDGKLVGGQSLLEASLEARMLEPRKLYGAIAFVDLGGVALEDNPFADGLSGAIGVGGRLRTFYIPVAVDLSYRILDSSALRSPIALEPWSLFIRLGEAF